MKKALITVSAFLFVFSLFAIGTASYAGDSVKGKGKIIKMDAEKGTIVFRPSGTKDEVPINVDPADLEGLAEGDVVMVQYTAGDTNECSRIKKLKAVNIPVGC